MAFLPWMLFGGLISVALFAIDPVSDPAILATIGSIAGAFLASVASDMLKKLKE